MLRSLSDGELPSQDMSGRINMHHIAKRAGVSLGTVSNVINRTAAVREPLRQRVLEAIRALGYQPSQLARGLRRDYTNMIGMIIPDITNPFFPALVRAAEDVAYRHQYRLVLCNSDNDPEKESSYLEELKSYLPAGLLVIPAEDSRLRDQPVRNGRRIPMICIDREPVGWKGDTVRADNETGAYLATMHLIDHGHRHIATIAGPPHLTSATERLKGFRRALNEASLPLPTRCVVHGQFDRASGFEAALKLLRPVPRPTAIFAGNDLMAMGVLMALRELGLRCPDDVSVAGFDNIDMADLLHPPLTSVQQPVYRLGAAAAELLIQRIGGQAGTARRILLETELVRRASVARLAQEPRAARVRAASH
jgi:DNA-binding LacI/PurR family transcriptional regulator